MGHGACGVAMSAMEIEACNTTPAVANPCGTQLRAVRCVPALTQNLKETPVSIEEEIRNAAYSRWEARGERNGDPWQDWFAAERRVDRRFYHSFPRAGRKTADEIPNGLAILRLIAKYGFLLTPETHEISQELNNPPRVMKARLVQQRFCLTELHPSEVPWHAVEFGRFALEFDITSARSIGAMPVLYFNRSTPDEAGTWYLARMLNHLSFVRHKLLWRLIELAGAVDQAAKNGDRDALIQLKNGATVTAIQAANFLDFLEASGDFDPRQLESTIRLTSCLWSPTENLKYNSLMGYFKQREWRLVPGPERSGLQYKDLLDEHKAALLAQNPRFFGSAFDIEPSKKALRVDACKLLPQVDGRHVLTTVRRIIAPKKAIHDVEQIVAPLGMSLEVVATEELW